MGYKGSVLKGVSWVALLRVSTRLLTFVRLAILGRLLTPLEFGFFGIASFFLSLLEIFTETGINVFLIQHKGHIKEYVDSAWVVSIIRGFILAILIFFSASFVSNFFNAPGSYNIIVLISLVPLIRGFINPAIVSYQKDLTFNKEFNFRSFLFFLDVTVSLIVGFFLRSAIAFVYGQIASAILEVFLSYTLIQIRPRVKLELDKVKHVLTRGIFVTATGIFSYFADNGDNITVGKILGSSTLGIYQVAYKFSTLPISEVANVMNLVIFPVYSKFSEDTKRLKRAFFMVTAANTFGALVLGISIFVFARPIIYIVMGSQWVQAVPAVQILAIYGILRTIFGSFASLFLSVQKQNYVAAMTFVRVISLAILVIPLVSRFGMVGAGYAMLASVLFEIPVIIYFTFRVFRETG